MSDYIVIHGIKVHKDYANFVPETFGRLTTIGPRFQVKAGNYGKYVTYQVCECQCGNIVTVRSGHLPNSNTGSCGCLHRDRVIKTKTKHGKSNTSEHDVWQGMVCRCTSKKGKSYQDYAGRGIDVCARWREPNGQGFINFNADMGPRPGPEYTIERKDVNGNYEPGNCEWILSKLQGRNKRNNRLLTHKGKTQCVAAWADELGVVANKLYHRIYRGWTDTEVIEGRGHGIAN